MPSPLGHTLASVAAGWGIAGPAAERRALQVQIAALAVTGMAPDLDLLFGQHSGATHSLGAAAIAATVAALVRWPVASTRWRIWLVVAVVWTLHPVFDALAPHVSPPHGVLFWWPFSPDYIELEPKVFMPISRRYWLPGFVMHTLTAVTREIVILAPAVAMAYWVRRRGAGHTATPRSSPPHAKTRSLEG